MSISHRARARLLACLLAAAATLGALAFAPTAGAAKRRKHLPRARRLARLRLPRGPVQERARKQRLRRTVDVRRRLRRRLRRRAEARASQTADHQRRLPGETTETFIDGSGIPGYCAGGPTGTPFPYAFLHHSYAAHTSQLADALAILKENPNVSPITLDIGANDVLQFLASKCGFPRRSRAARPKSKPSSGTSRPTSSRSSRSCARPRRKRRSC